MLTKERLDQILSELMEHCDAVVILATVNEDEVTRGIFRRAGNRYAAQGMAQEFLEEMSNEGAAWTLAKEFHDPKWKPED